jgi:hypothetical protein
LARDSHFLMQAGQSTKIAEKPAREKFERNLLLQVQVVGPVDDAHAASTDRANNSVSAEKRCAGREVLVLRHSTRYKFAIDPRGPQVFRCRACLERRGRMHAGVRNVDAASRTKATPIGYVAQACMALAHNRRYFQVRQALQRMPKVATRASFLLYSHVRTVASKIGTAARIVLS